MQACPGSYPLHIRVVNTDSNLIHFSTSTITNYDSIKLTINKHRFPFSPPGKYKKVTIYWTVFAANGANKAY